MLWLGGEKMHLMLLYWFFWACFDLIYLVD